MGLLVYSSATALASYGLSYLAGDLSPLDGGFVASMLNHVDGRLTAMTEMSPSKFSGNRSNDDGGLLALGTRAG